MEMIAIVSPESVPIAGGVSSYSLNLALELAKTEEVVLVGPGNEDAILGFLSKIPGRSWERISVVSTSAAAGKEPAARTLRHQFGLPRAFRTLERKLEPRILHFTAAHGFGPSWFLSRRRFILTIHSHISEDVGLLRNSVAARDSFRPTDRLKLLCYPIVRSNEQAAFNNSSAIIGVSRRAIMLVGGVTTAKPLHFIRNGINTSIFSPRRDEELRDCPEKYI